MLADTIILFSTQDEVMRYRKRMASTCDDASLGVTVTTPEALIEELWDVWGSRERLVTSTQRTIIIKALLDGQEDWVPSMGTVSLLAPFLGEYLTFVDDRFSESHAEALTSTEESIVTFVRRYEAALREALLIEPAQALIKLAPLVKLASVIVRTQQDPPAYLMDFLEGVSDRVERRDPQLEPDDGQDPVKASYLLLRPQGRTAEAYLIARTLDKSRVAGSTIIITAPDPTELFDSMEDALIERGFTVSLEATRSFQDTLFGRAFDATVVLCGLSQEHSREAVLQAAATYLGSPYAQLSSVKRERLLASMRADRTLSLDDMRDALRSASRSFEYFEALTEESDAGILFGFFEDLVHRMQLDPVVRESELAVLARMKSLYAEARKLGQEPTQLFELIDALAVPYTRTSVPAGGLASRQCSSDGDGDLPIEASLADEPREHVLFTSLERAAALPAACCDVVVMAGLDSASYSGAQQRSTLTEFLDRFDSPRVDDTIEIMEARFERALRLARRFVIFEYALQSVSGEEHYPAFFLESFLNARSLREEPVEERTMGEECFDLAARMEPLTPASIEEEPKVVRGSLPMRDRARLLPFVLDREGNERPVVSASALEEYLNCPYSWFVKRKLNLDDAEEEFGAREQGTFVHSVFQAFYDEWTARGHDRVRPDTLEEAQGLLADVFDRLVLEQADRQPGDRYIAVSELEREQIAQLKRQVCENLSFQASVFPSYHVEGHEVALSVEEQLVYGGAIVHGRIDRVDVDENGNFVIIDYKGSLEGHEAGYAVPEDAEEEPFVAPGKIQALLYAQALKRRDPGRHPKAAVYLSYRAKSPKELLRGSIAETLPSALLHSNNASVVEGDLERYLDLVEHELAKTVERMVSGDIAPDPRDARACKYCPVLSCEKRIDGSQ